MSHVFTVAFIFFVIELWPFDCVFMLICFIEHSITHSLFMISACNFIGMCFR